MAVRPVRVELSNDQVREVQLAVLGEIDAACQRLGLRYYLWAGSLLGAVRHAGYIPWDDDIDVAMPRADFERFCAEFEADHLDVFTLDRHPRYAYPFARVADRRTEIREGLAMSIPMGVNVDIFPLDGWPTSHRAARLHRAVLTVLHALVAFVNTGANPQRAAAKELLRRTLQPIASLIPMRWTARAIAQVARRHDFDASAEVGVTVFRYLEQVDSSSYGAPTTVSFESSTRRAPADPDSVLTNLYGDYMTPPPEGQRTPQRHALAAYRIG